MQAPFFVFFVCLAAHKIHIHSLSRNISRESMMMFGPTTSYSSLEHACRVGGIEKNAFTALEGCQKRQTISVSTTS
jgi:hypothetical protein